MKIQAPRAFPASAKNFADLPDDARVPAKVVEIVTGRSRATIARYVDRGLLPQPIRVPGCQNAWRVGDLRQALCILAGDGA